MKTASSAEFCRILGFYTSRLQTFTMEQVDPQDVDLISRSPCCLESMCTEKNQARSFMTSTHASVRCSILVFTDIPAKNGSFAARGFGRQWECAGTSSFNVYVSAWPGELSEFDVWRRTNAVIDYFTLFTVPRSPGMRSGMPFLTALIAIHINVQAT